MAVYQFYREQKLKVGMNEIWDFISSPKNLKVITPDYMGFDVTTKHLVEKMYPGMIITYKVSPVFKLKVAWVTEITQVHKHRYFVDEQRSGPYKMWHHEHMIEEIEGGILMKDLITYEPPLGFLGKIANTFMIRSKIEEIFNYRRKVLKERFGEL